MVEHNRSTSQQQENQQKQTKETWNVSVLRLNKKLALIKITKAKSKSEVVIYRDTSFFGAQRYQDGFLMHCQKKKSTKNAITTQKFTVTQELEEEIEQQSYVGIRSRSELFNTTVRTNVFNNVTKRSFVLLPFTTLATTTTTARLFLTAFRFHYNIHASSLQRKQKNRDRDNQIHKSEINQHTHQNTSVQKYLSRMKRSGKENRNQTPQLKSNPNLKYLRNLRQWRNKYRETPGIPWKISKQRKIISRAKDPWLRNERCRRQGGFELCEEEMKLERGYL